MTTSYNTVRSANVHGEEVEILTAADSERYLGKKLCVNNLHSVELYNRISAAWGAFSKFKPALCSRKLPFIARLKLFEAVVAPVALYGSAFWTVTDTMRAALRTAWRQMLRMMLGARRAADEDWIQYVQRPTHTAEELASKIGVKDWSVQQRFQKLKFAGEAARATANKWSTRLLHWRPFFRCEPRRKVGHPYTRWSDSIVQIAGKNWTELANDFALWAALSDGFCSLF